LEDAKEKIEIWMEEYNTFKLHSFLGDLTPEMFIKKKQNSRIFYFRRRLNIGRGH